jgi:hypothetical protein
VSSDRPIFVVGCPRSGTTMLGLMIHAHPRLAMPPENRFVLHTWRRRRQFGDLSTEEQRRAIAAHITRKGSLVKDMGLSNAAVAELIAEQATTFGDAFGLVFQEFARANGKARWGDKRPAYFGEVDMLLRLFPDAQFVHLLRDGRANVASLKRMPWWPETSIGSMAVWSTAEWCLRRDAARLPADTFHSMRYEDLVADPRTVLTRLCDFLEEDFDEAMLEPSKVREVVPERKVWHERLSGAVDSSTVESWRTGLEPWELGLMETVLGRTLKRNGYALSGDGKRPSLHALSHYAKSLSTHRKDMRRRWKKEALEAETRTFPVAARLTTRQKELAGAS